MALYINQNTYSMRAGNALRTHYNNIGTSIERLSSGLKINSAKDDPTGFAIREEMRSEIGVYNKGLHNLSLGVSMLQTAEGAMAVIDEKLTRMREVAEQAATGTYTDTQRLLLNSEFNAMASEIDRIAASTRFHGISLIDGDLSTGNMEAYTSGGWNQHVPGYQAEDGFYQQPVQPGQGGLKIHFGLTNDRLEDYYYISIADMSTNALFGYDQDQNLLPGQDISLATQQGAQSALERLGSAIQRKEIGRANLGAMINRLESTIDHLTLQVENTQQAESRISDIDVAEEMTHFIEGQMMIQAATAVLAQANTLPEIALRLLR